MNNNQKILTIREKIARRLVYYNISMLSDRLKINYRTLAQLKNPQNGNPTTETLVKVCDFLGISL